MITVRQVARSASVYPITALYLAGAALIMAVADSLLTPVFAVGVLAFVAVLVSLYATWRELRALHALVNGQRTDLLLRIDELSQLLTDSGVVVPIGSQIEQNARDDAIRKGVQR